MRQFRLPIYDYARFHIFRHLPTHFVIFTHQLSSLTHHFRFLCFIMSIFDSRIICEAQQNILYFSLASFSLFIVLLFLFRSILHFPSCLKTSNQSSLSMKLEGDSILLPRSLVIRLGHMYTLRPAVP